MYRRRSELDTGSKIIIMVVFLVGVLCMSLAQCMQEKDYTATTVGTVVKFHESRVRLRRGTKYTYNMEWEYVVNGVTYHNSKHCTIKTSIQNITQGGTAEVMYDPENPADSMLIELHNAKKSANGIAFGVVVVILAFYFVKYKFWD